MQRLRHPAICAICAVLLFAVGCSDDSDDDGISRDTGQTESDADAGTNTPDGQADTDPGSDADTGDSDTDTDADTGADADSGNATGLILQGELVPTGGMSMSSSFTLSGHLSPGMPEYTSSSASFLLELTPAHSETNN